MMPQVFMSKSAEIDIVSSLKARGKGAPKKKRTGNGRLEHS